MFAISELVESWWGWILTRGTSVGHTGKFGHEFLQFEFRPDGKFRYANNSHYKNEQIIRKECYVSDAVLEEVRRIVADSEIVQCVP